MTPEDRARAVVLPWYRGPYGLHVDDSYQQKEITDIAAAIRTAINDKLEEVAREIEALESGTYTTAQTPAGLVRAMKVK